jgi:hypothetical protein
MTAAAPLIQEPARPAIDIVRTTSKAILIVRGEGRMAVAWLDRRALCRVLAGYRHALDARALGGITTTVELNERSLDVPAPRAAAARLSADGSGVRLALLDVAGHELASAPFDDEAVARLNGDDP